MQRHQRQRGPAGARRQLVPRAGRRSSTAAASPSSASTTSSAASGSGLGSPPRRVHLPATSWPIGWIRASRPRLLAGRRRRPGLAAPGDAAWPAPDPRRGARSLALAAVMVGPALLPGRALSSPDMLVVLDALGVPSARRTSPHPANADLQDAAQQFQPLREEVKRRAARRAALGSLDRRRAPLLPTPSRPCSRRSRSPAYVMPLQKSLAWTALLTLLDRRSSGCTCSAARSGCASPGR